MKKLKILIIDDFEPLLEDMKESLELENYKVFTAGDGAEGVQQAILNKPDLIICDIQMPKMNGYDVYKTLEKIPETSVIPFIFLTALAQAEDFRKGLSMGADDYLIKPFQLEALLSTIKKRLDKLERYRDTNKQKFDALINNPLFGSYIVKNDSLVFVNERFIEITGYARSELNNLKYSDLIIGKPDKLVVDFNMCLSGIKDSFQHKISVLNKNKEAIFLHLYGRHIEMDGENAILGSVVQIESQEQKLESPPEFAEIIDYLNNSGKNNIAEEILKTMEIIDFGNEIKEDTVKITKREKEVLTLICQGLTNTEIAEKLFLSSRTIENHRAKLLSKTETKNTAGLVAWAIGHKKVTL